MTLTLQERSMTITTEEAEALASHIEKGLMTRDIREALAILRTLAAQRDQLRDRAEAAEAGNLSKVPVGEWQECLEPIIARFEVTGALGDDFTAVHNSKGSAALGKLFRKMSQTLDAAVDALGRAERAETARDEAISQLSGISRELGEAEGKLAASEMAGVVEGWKARAERAEAEVERLRALVPTSHQTSTRWTIDRGARTQTKKPPTAKAGGS